MNILFVGCGNIGRAILKGMLDSNNFSPENIDVIVPSLSSAEKLKQDFNIDVYTSPPLKNYDAIILAVKPQVISDVISEYKAAYGHLENIVIISIIAGKTISYFEKFFPKQDIVRTMPNLNCQVKLGSTVGSMSENCSPIATNLVEKIFTSIGSYTWVAENLIDTISAISGSGPAYYFLFTESLIKAAVALGIEEKLAYSLANETFIGSAKIAEQSNLNLAELRKAVTSLKGTTDAALKVMQKDDALTKIMIHAMQNAIARAAELKN